MGPGAPPSSAPARRQRRGPDRRPDPGGQRVERSAVDPEVGAGRPSARPARRSTAAGPGRARPAPCGGGGSEATSARWSSTASRLRTPSDGMGWRGPATRAASSVSRRRSARIAMPVPGHLDPATRRSRASSTMAAAQAVGVLWAVWATSVGDGGVDLVADAGEHRDLERGDRAGDELVVEGGQVGAGPAAADERDQVDAGAGRGEQGGGDRALRSRALHPGVDHHDLPGQGAVGEGLEEVGFGGAAGRGHQPDAPRDRREGEQPGCAPAGRRSRGPRSTRSRSEASSPSV